jgi:hypothetical protein
MRIGGKGTDPDRELIRRGRPSKREKTRAYAKLRPLLLKLSERDFALLEELRAATGAASWAEVIRQALRVFAGKISN